MQTYPSSNRFYSFFFGVFRSNRLERLRNYMIVMFMKSDFFLPFTQKQLSYFCTNATKILFKVALKNFFVKYFFKKTAGGTQWTVTSVVCCPFCPSGPLKRLKMPSHKYPAFFEKEILLRSRLRRTRGARGEAIYRSRRFGFFSREKKFSLSPDSHPPYQKTDQISSLPTMSVMDLYP